jgi:hypothetical protein
MARINPIGEVKNFGRFRLASSVVHWTNKGVVTVFFLAQIGCATRTKPDYEMITNFIPDCKNEDAQIRFLTKLKRFKTTGDVSDKKFDKTVDIQIERLQYYCRYE